MVGAGDDNNDPKEIKGDRQKQKDACIFSLRGQCLQNALEVTRKRSLANPQPKDSGGKQPYCINLHICERCHWLAAKIQNSHVFG
jgi:hypothetical protein